MDSKGEDFIIKQTKILAGIGLGLSAVVVIAVLLLAISVQNTLKSTDEQEQSGWRWREDSQGGLVGNFYDDGNLIRWVEHEYDEAGNKVKGTGYRSDGSVAWVWPRESRDTFDEILRECLSDYQIHKSENEEWVLYECKPEGDSLYTEGSTVAVKKEFKEGAFTYETAKSFLKEWIDYDEMWNYTDSDNEYGITELFKASQDDEAYYLIEVGSGSYFVRVQGKLHLQSELELWASDYVINQYSETIIECADGIQTHVISDISYGQKKAWYEFAVNENEVYRAVLECEEGTDAMQYHFLISHEDDEIQNINWTNWDGFYQPGYPSFLDVNMDGYMDMMVAVYSYPSFDVHELYIWNPEERCFEKVIYDGILANIEVREDSVRNWIRNGTGYILETLQWKGNELILTSTEEVLPED